MVTGWELRRCPRAVDLLPATDDLLALYHEGHLEHLSPVERRCAPAKLMAALMWVDEVWREHKRLTTERDNGSG